MRYGSVKSLAAAALIFGSSHAMAAPQSSAQALSLAPVAAGVPTTARAGAPGKEGRSSLGGGNGLGIALLAVVGAGAAYGLYEMIDGDSDDNPVSN